MKILVGGSIGSPRGSKREGFDAKTLLVLLRGCPKVCILVAVLVSILIITEIEAGANTQVCLRGTFSDKWQDLRGPIECSPNDFIFTSIQVDF
jgi:hypothetical protein